MATFRETLQARIATWKAEHGARCCPVDVRDEIAAKLREEWGPVRGGFASFTPEQRREIASRGGQAARASGKAHRFTPETGKAAGALGGATAHQLGRAHRFTPEEARAANQVARKGDAKRFYGLGVGDQPPEAGATLYRPQRLAIESARGQEGLSLWWTLDPQEGASPIWTFQRRLRATKG